MPKRLDHGLLHGILGLVARDRVSDTERDDSMALEERAEGVLVVPAGPVDQLVVGGVHGADPRGTPAPGNRFPISRNGIDAPACTVTVVFTPRRRRELDRAPEPLPLLPGEVGNGEFVPRPPTPRDRAIVREILERSEAIARRQGPPAANSSNRPVALR